VVTGLSTVCRSIGSVLLQLHGPLVRSISFHLLPVHLDGEPRNRCRRCWRTERHPQ
jgi:hypothetical protein